jgi:hypothetical protein
MMTKGVTSKMITIRGVTYADAAEAAAALNVGRAAILDAQRRGALDRVGMRRRYRDFEINGRRFANLAAAAKHFGVCTGRIEQAVRAGNTSMLGKRRRPFEMQISVRGQVFPNAQAAADAFGVGRSAVYAAIYRGEIDRLGLPPRRVLNNIRAFTIAGLSWPSEAAACRALGLRRDFICRMRQRDSETMRQDLIGAAMRFKAAQDSEVRAARARTADLDDITPVAILGEDDRKQYADLLASVSGERGIAVSDICGPSRRGPHVAARREVWARLRDLGMSVRRIATLAERDWASVQTGLERYGELQNAHRARKVAA